MRLSFQVILSCGKLPPKPAITPLNRATRFLVFLIGPGLGVTLSDALHHSPFLEALQARGTALFAALGRPF